MMMMMMMSSSFFDDDDDDNKNVIPKKPFEYGICKMSSISHCVKFHKWLSAFVYSWAS